MNQLFNVSKLKLGELKDIARATPKPVRWAMVWFLLWIEPKYIDYKSKQAVDAALRQYNKVFGTDINVVIDNVKPIHTTKSEVEGLDDMSIGNHPECDI
mgnify:FL=1|tara:strand:+ start:200 stop:496 length:297 start_codon:yes stop_codon:yes gene_type:complete